MFAQNTMRFFVRKVMEVTKQLRGYDVKQRQFCGILEDNRKVLGKTTNKWQNFGGSNCVKRYFR